MLPIVRSAALVLAALAIACGVSDRARFERSLDYSLKANQISRQLPTLGLAETKRQERLMCGYIEKSLALGNRVSAAYLDSLHPSLAHYYKDVLMEGQRLYLQGVRTDSLPLQFRGNALVMQWASFWSTAQDRLPR